MGRNFKLHAVLISALAMTFSCVAVQAQEEGEEGSRFADVETSRVRPLSQSTARALEPVRGFLAPEAEEEGGPVPEPNPQAALTEIRDIRIDRLPGHEKAEIYYLYGYIYYSLEDMPQVKSYWQQILDEPEANLPLVIRTMKSLAQVHMVEEEYDQALDLYLEWMSYQEIIGASDYALVGNIYYALEDQQNALSYIERAINMREEIGEVGQESWYSIQKSIYYTRGDYPRVIEILKKMVVYYPNHRHWREMAGMYAELEMENEQMAAYDIAWLQDGLTSGNQVLALAYTYIGRGAPLQGAETLIKGIEDGLVEETDRNLQTIGSAFYQARELDQALVWMERAAERATDGEPYGRLTSIYVDMGRYEDAYRTALEALDQGGLSRPDQVRLQAGNALYNLYRYDEAIDLFRTIRDERSRETANTWIRFVESEASRERQLRDSGIDIDAIRDEVWG